MGTREMATLFTGGGGFDEGAKIAGFTPVLGVEMNLAIGLWAEENTPGLRVIWSKVEEVEYSQFQTPYHVHASPSCKNASNANSTVDEETGVKETRADLEAAQGICQALIALQPPVFSLENVYFYRTFQSFKLILRTLHGLGYAFDYWHLNSADYGVPQTRKRLVLVARRDRKPTRPVATHTNPANLNGQMSLFGQQLKPWVGWLEAVQDIVDTLPDSEFPPWQEARLPAELLQSVLVEGRNGSGGSRTLTSGEPAMTVTTSHPPRAFLVDQVNHRGGDGKSTIRNESEPVWTIPVYSSKHLAPRAFIVDCQKSGMPESNGGLRGLTIRESTQPIFTLTANQNKRTVRACLEQGRVVRMTPRALARFQSVPDSYLLPDNDQLACKIIGNMVPPLLAKAICESVKD